ncbi:MAG: hypothetical protein IT342_21750 [Candidatus Melainabacteria bacterium]|nr:hypothetical protein [Candidatus Melainabacteria bacterium]
MHKTLKDFVGATHVDETDKLAQRALMAYGKCAGMIANAYNRGDAEAYSEVSRAHYEASAAFVLINQHKAYPFADEVIAGMAVQAVSAEEPAAAAAYLIGAAETTIAAYAHRCTPVCMVSGIDSVRILRGAHAIEAMRDVVAANAA